MAPLNWGLGHAARCIPIVKALLQFGFHPVLAGDGDALDYLKKEFPELPFYELPSTSVSYSKNGGLLKYKLLSQAPKFLKTIALEREQVKEIHRKENLSGIISDNRFGVWSEEVPSVYITHQLKVLSGNTSSLTTTLHQKIINKFDQCWVPDYEFDALAGNLSARNKKVTSVKYIGPLSRFKRKPSKKKWDLMAVLSGPEPQRSMLEKKLLDELQSFPGKSLIVQGILKEEQTLEHIGNISKVNFMLYEELRDTIEAAELVISRSGYSSIMDFQALEAKAFFIPTPGQFEQEYLAKYVKERGFANFSDQDSFSMTKLSDALNYKGFGYKKTPKRKLDRSLFDVFDSI